MEQEDLTDATVLVSLRFVNEKGGERFEAYIGRIIGFESSDQFESLDDESSANVMLVECHDGEIREYPFDLDVFESADPGFYELDDGATIENPDYLLQWRITEPAKH